MVDAYWQAKLLVRFRILHTDLDSWLTTDFITQNDLLRHNISSLLTHFDLFLTFFNLCYLLLTQGFLNEESLLGLQSVLSDQLLDTLASTGLF